MPTVRYTRTRVVVLFVVVYVIVSEQHPSERRPSRSGGGRPWAGEEPG